MSRRPRPAARSARAVPSSPRPPTPPSAAAGPASRPCRRAADRDPAQGAEHVGHGDQSTGCSRRPVALLHQPRQRVRPHEELRHHQQHRDAVHPRREAVGPVGVRGQGGGRTWARGRARSENTAPSASVTATTGDPERCLPHPPVGGHRDRGSRHGDAQRLRHLTDPHSQPAALRREPPLRRVRWPSWCWPRTSPPRTGRRTAGPYRSIVVANTRRRRRFRRGRSAARSAPRPGPPRAPRGRG